jgi:hypothetical protein
MPYGASLLLIVAFYSISVPRCYRFQRNLGNFIISVQRVCSSDSVLGNGLKRIEGTKNNELLANLAKFFDAVMVNSFSVLKC